MAKKKRRRLKMARPMTERERAKAAKALREVINLLKRVRPGDVIQIVGTKKRRRRR
jgi:hypothetical protein